MAGAGTLLIGFESEFGLKASPYQPARSQACDRKRALRSAFPTWLTIKTASHSDELPRTDTWTGRTPARSAINCSRRSARRDGLRGFEDGAGFGGGLDLTLRTGMPRR